MGERIDYDADGTAMVGYRARPERPNGAVLLVVPAFMGLRSFEKAQCDRFAAMGYEAMGVDYYGEGWTTEDGAAASKAMAELNGDRGVLLRRCAGALEIARGWGGKVGAMGFCFGGKAVLDMARAGHLDAAVSMHGIYDRPPFATGTMPPVLLCHGWNDPLAKPADFEAMAAELEAHSPDWHALCFGQTGHAFTDPARGGDAGMGFVDRSASRTWAAVETFLAEKLG